MLHVKRDGFVTRSLMLLTSFRVLGWSSNNKSRERGCLLQGGCYPQRCWRLVQFPCIISVSSSSWRH